MYSECVKEWGSEWVGYCIKENNISEGSFVGLLFLDYLV